MTGNPVLVAPAIDPGSARIDVTVPQGLTISEIIATAIPHATEADLAQARVTLCTATGSSVILPGHWRMVRPRPGVRVVIRLIPGKGALKAVLSIVVSIAAVALGAMFGPALAGTLGLGATTWGAVITLGVNLLGSLLINALIPPVKPDDERRQSYSISGWRNRLDPDGAVPVVLGQILYAPPFAARSYTEIVGDWQYIRAFFNFGEGPLDLSDFRIGDTSIADYDEVEIEVRQGLPGDLPASLYPRQIVEEQIGVELTRPFPRNDVGDRKQISETYEEWINTGHGDGRWETRTRYIDLPAVETPVVRTTGADAESVSVMLAFPAGLIRFDDKGRKRQHGVTVRIEQRLVQADEWQPVATLNIVGTKTEAFYRQHTWQFPSRGRWQVRCTMMTDESDDSKVTQRTVWAGLQTIRPEYPLNYHRPLALVAVRVKATHQLSGALDNFSALARRVCLDWDIDTQSWIMRPTSNPASLYRYVLQCPANPKPAPDAEIDIELLQDWHEFCSGKGLHYNRVVDQAGSTLREVLTEVAAAGRASPRHDGIRWGVVIDRPAELIVDHVSPRNSWGFSSRRAYVEKPHAWICKFQDEGNDFKEAQRVIRRPGYTGDITLTETLELPGITDPAIVYREGLRRFFEAEYRPDTIEVTQEGAVRVATRGDALMLSHDVLSLTQWAGRVRAASASLVEIDELVTMQPGENYALRFRVFADADDSVGTSVVRPVQNEADAINTVTNTLFLSGSGPIPTAGEIVLFGLLGSESHQIVVTGIEATEDQCQIIRAVSAAPIIDELTDAAEIPAWSSRVGEEIDENLLQPPAPRFTSITSGVAGTDTEGLITYLLAPGSGAISASLFRVEHRLGTSGDWTAVEIPAANGGGAINGYAQGDTVQLRAGAISYGDISGPMTDAVTLVVGAADAPIPAALDPEAITISTLLGGALIQIATGDDPNTTQIQIYRSTSPVLNRETDAVGAPYAVGPMQTFSFALGDTTRSNMINGGSMDSPAAWDTDAGWEIEGGQAVHTPGTADAISQAQGFEAGKWYRLGYTVSGRTAGSLMPEITGGSDRTGSPTSANGQHRDRIQAVTGNGRIGFAASSTFDGALDDVVCYMETAACLAPGLHYVFLEPANDDSVPGSVSGPFVIEVI